MSNPVPGPWRLWKSDGPDEYPEWNVGDRRLVGANDICIGILFGGYSSFPELEHSHCLAAAAPELLAALKHCVIERSEWLEEARNAIAKAEGRR